MKTTKQASAIPLRLAPDLRAWLQVKARENRRSMNGEVTVLLERYRAQQQKEAIHG